MSKGQQRRDANRAKRLAKGEVFQRTTGNMIAVTRTIDATTGQVTDAPNVTQLSRQLIRVTGRAVIAQTLKERFGKASRRTRRRAAKVLHEREWQRRDKNIIAKLCAPRIDAGADQG